ncbi:MAG: type VI secretion system baseplate subunit TssG [candidate division Zixibacteria bacterium]|nr:type VI secretion system baseplate subunit TssG [candidate division Zixibacteria bacterium]
MSPARTATMPNFCDRHQPFHATTALMTLMRLGVDVDTIELLAAGEHENYRGEVREQEPKAGTEIGPGTRIRLHVGCVGVVDHMPYQFFYGLDPKANRPRTWEDNARRLTAPFDSAVIRHESIARFQELLYGQGFTERGHTARYLDLFHFEDSLISDAHDEGVLWSALMPLFHQWAGNAESMARVLHMVFGYEFEIIESVPKTYDIPPELQLRLGSPEARLGHETLLGDSFTESDSCYEVVVRGVPADEVSRFLPGGDGRGKLERILAFCAPGNLEYRLRIRSTAKCRSLGTTGDDARLGYTAYV